MRQKINVALCEGRHQMPEGVNDAIFDCNLTMVITKPNVLQSMAMVRLSDICEEAGVPTHIVQDEDGEDVTALDLSAVDLVIYVTGLSVALIAAINAAKFGGFRSITLMHYDRETGNYYPQVVA